MFYCEKEGSFGLKSQVFYRKNGGSFWTEKSSVLLRKRGRFETKSVFYCKKGGHFQTGEQGWVSLFPVSEGAGYEPQLFHRHLPISGRRSHTHLPNYDMLTTKLQPLVYNVMWCNNRIGHRIIMFSLI